MSNNAFSKLMSVGAPEILLGRQQSPGGGQYLGEPALRLPEGAAPPGGVQYRPDDYNAADWIMFGISNGVPGGIAIGAGVQANLIQAPGNPFKPLRLFAPSTISPGLFLVQVSYGAFNLISGDPVALEMISEVSLANAISWPTVQTSQNVTCTILNAGPAPVANVALAMYGVRLR